MSKLKPIKMKNVVLFLVTVVVLFSCKNDATTKSSSQALNSTNDVVKKIPTLQGVWELVGHYNYVDNKVADSFKIKNGHRQIKMYTKNKIMWSKHVLADSSELFGYGSYTNDHEMLTEILDYGSALMNKAIAEKKEFNYELDLKENTFSQIETDDDGNRIYSENYVRVE